MEKLLWALFVVLCVVGVLGSCALVVSLASGRIYRGDICEFRTWGHCAGRRALEASNE